MGRVGYKVLQSGFKTNVRSFKEASGDVDLRPTLENLRAFFKWCALESEGRIDKNVTLSTLNWQVGRFVCMYNNAYPDKISEETKDKLRGVRFF